MRDLACGPFFVNCIVWTGTASKAEAHLTPSSCSRKSSRKWKIWVKLQVPKQAETSVCWLWGAFHLFERFYTAQGKKWLTKTQLQVSYSLYVPGKGRRDCLYCHWGWDVKEKFMKFHLSRPSVSAAINLFFKICSLSILLFLFHASSLGIFLFFSCPHLVQVDLLWLLNAGKFC